MICFFFIYTLRFLHTYHSLFFYYYLLPSYLSIFPSGLAGVSLLSFVPGVDPSAVMSFIGGSCMGSVAKMAVAFPLTFQYINGMRHFYWDRTPDALTNDQVENTSYAVALSSFFTALFITVM